VHGTAPKYAGKNVINPTAVIFSAVMMLRHLGEFEAAGRVEHAVLVTLEDGKTKTGDIVGYDKGASTSVYTETIIANLGRKSGRWRVRDYKPLSLPRVGEAPDFVKAKTRRVVGADLFVESPLGAEELGKSLERLAEGSALRLKMISNRGTKVYPPTGAMTDCTDHWFCRFVLRAEGGEMGDADLFDLVRRVAGEHRWVHLEKLLEIDGVIGFTKAQGED
jgi:isocitrate dehydrogenase